MACRRTELYAAVLHHHMRPRALTTPWLSAASYRYVHTSTQLACEKSFLPSMRLLPRVVKGKKPREAMLLDFSAFDVSFASQCP